MAELRHGAAAVADGLQHGHDGIHADAITAGDFFDDL
jgi:hypothetical protein